MLSTRSRFMGLLMAVTALSSFLTLAPTEAQITYSGNTTGGPTFNRPLVGMPPTALSGTHIAVRYHTFSFTPTTTGLYSFFCQADGAQDPFLAFYQSPFNAATPLANLLATNDDIEVDNFSQSGFEYPLTAGTNYTLVTTGFSATDFGPFDNEINLLAALRGSVDGSTTGGPTWQRPDEGTPPTTLSTTATAVPYQVVNLEVNTSGHYYFFVQRRTTDFDTYMLLYQNSFNPASQLTNALTGNDDYKDDSRYNSVSYFEFDLTAGTPYFVVLTGFDNTDIGNYHLEVFGPAAVRLFIPRTISGTVSLADCENVAYTATFVLRPANNSGDITRTVSIPANGSFTLNDVPAGNYQIKVYTHNTLSDVVTANATSGNVTGLTVGPLKGGDATGDNTVDVLDLDKLIQSFDKCQGDTGYIPGADFDCNNCVDVLDLDVLIRNFDQAGEDFS